MQEKHGLHHVGFIGEKMNISEIIRELDKQVSDISNKLIKIDSGIAGNIRQNISGIKTLLSLLVKKIDKIREEF